MPALPPTPALLPTPFSHALIAGLTGALLIAGSLVLAGAALAQSTDTGAAPEGGEAEANGSLVDLGDITCKDVMGQSDERPRTISFLHGYVAGEAGRTEMDVDGLTAATDVFIDRCLDNPTANALETLKGAVE